MKRSLVLVGTLIALTGFLAAQTQEERHHAVKYLDEIRAKVMEATKGLSVAQLNFKPAPDRWSVAEVAEHIAAAEDILYGTIQDQVMKAPARPTGEDVKAINEFVLAAIPDRTDKAQAPEPLKPTNRFASLEGTLKHFNKSRDKTVGFVRTGQGLRDHAVNSPLGRKLDAYEWVLFIAAQRERHSKQILEVKADPKLPKS